MAKSPNLPPSQGPPKFEFLLFFTRGFIVFRGPLFFLSFSYVSLCFLGFHYFSLVWAVFGFRHVAIWVPLPGHPGGGAWLENRAGHHTQAGRQLRREISSKNNVLGFLLKKRGVDNSLPPLAAPTWPLMRPHSKGFHKLPLDHLGQGCSSKETDFKGAPPRPAAHL